MPGCCIIRLVAMHSCYANAFDCCTWIWPALLATQVGISQSASYFAQIMLGILYKGCHWPQPSAATTSNGRWCGSASGAKVDPEPLPFATITCRFMLDLSNMSKEQGAELFFQVCLQRFFLTAKRSMASSFWYLMWASGWTAAAAAAATARVMEMMFCS